MDIILSQLEMSKLEMTIERLSANGQLRLALKHRFSVLLTLHPLTRFLMLWWLPTIKLVSLLFNFATLTNCNINMWFWVVLGDPCERVIWLLKGGDPQAGNHCINGSFRSVPSLFGMQSWHTFLLLPNSHRGDKTPSFAGVQKSEIYKNSIYFF